MKTTFVELGIVPASGTPTQFGKFIADETEKWSKVVNRMVEQDDVAG
jgi:hypothetical protein